MSRVTQRLKDERNARKLTLHDAAELCGWTNTDSGARRIESYENEERRDRDVFDKLVQAYEIPAEEINELSLLDHDDRVAEWKHAMANVTSLDLTWQTETAVRVRHPLRSDSRDLDEAILQGRELASAGRKRVMLLVNEREYYFFNADGSYRSAGGPYANNSPIVERNVAFG